MLAATMLAAPLAQAATVTTQPPTVVYPTPELSQLYPQGIGFNPVVDYTKPQFAQSPNIRKFIDSLPGLGAGNKNNLGQYIPLATPDQTSFPGSDYYEIGLKSYSQQMSSDLPPTGTLLRGYYQKNGADNSIKYLGPAIVAHRDRPVRFKFFNELPLGSAGDLPLPVDTGVMGAGMGPNGGAYNQNRGVLHLHGGFTPWISDGTPHQWITPAGDPNAMAAGPDYQKGASFENVPDMINPSTVNGVAVPCAAKGPATCFTPTASDGIGTYYYTNQQSGRLLFYHDHSFGITRLNVYAGEAAPYIITDQVEEDLLKGTNLSGGNPAGKQILPDLGGVYHWGIPLVIQDKAFVNDATTPLAAAKAAFPAPATGYVPTSATLSTDPLWQYYVGTGGGNLWMPHEYMPIENIFDPTGNTPNGRYDYAPFMNPPMVPTNLVLPSPTIVPETFVDTAVVNGAAFPYLELPPDAVRFRILNASNDRTLNLHLYKADPLRISVTNGGAGYAAAQVTINQQAGNVGSYSSATAIVSPGTISSIDVVGASHYIFPPTVTLSGGGGTCSSVSAVIPSNSSGLLDITASGCTGFTSAPTVTITGGGGGTYTSATANIIPKGVITGIQVVGATGYRSDLAAPTVTITDTTPGSGGASAVAFVNTEVKMVDAAPNPNYPTWPVDGRDGGAPDPTTSGPSWIQIGNESGLLAQAAVWPPQPVVYEQARQAIPTLGVTYHSLLLMPAMRADVVVDLTGYHDGDTLILYNDGSAPMPGFWPIDDYYTDAPDMTGVGGAPSTPPGFGPNTRTVMQIRIKGTKTSSFTFDANALKTALPAAFAAAQERPLVPQMAYNDAYPGFASFDTYAQNNYDTLNLTGIAQPVVQIKTTAPGNNYTTAPTVNIVGGGGSGATATAGLNPCGGITLLTAGAGYTTPPVVTIGTPASTYTAPAAPPAGTTPVAATAVATISGGTVNALTLDEPGSYYNTNTADLKAVPTCKVAPPTGCVLNTTTCVAATCSTFIAVANTVGSISITNQGSGYNNEPYVYLSGGGGIGAMAKALVNGALVFTGKNLTEGFDPDYGRMDIRLGSTPNPLTPTVGNGMVVGVARYIDPPTEILNDGEVILWRLTHLGVDSHAMHFHLFDLQVVNRVDWTNVVKPPYPDEIGWRETIRTNPMEDIIVAMRPHAMALPFPIPKSSRLLDVTNAVNVNTNFLPVAPPAGIAAVPQITNSVTDFGWEYVWHCHLLGHEENDMMRPIVLLVTPPTAPTTLTGSVSLAGAQSQVSLSWTSTSVNETSFLLQRSTSSTFPAATTVSISVNKGATGYLDADPALLLNTNYYYRVQAMNGAGSSAWSNTLTILTPAGPPAPAGLTATVSATGTTASVTLNWTNNNLAVQVQRSTSSTFPTGTSTVTFPTVPAGTASYLNTPVALGTYYYRIRNVTSAGVSISQWSPTVTAAVSAPAVPTGLRVTAARTSGASTDQATLTWTATGSITSFTIQRATNAAFTTGARSFTVTPGTLRSWTDTGLVRGTRYYYRMTANNAVGSSGYAVSVNVLTP
jgi:FtsP/CotA-like multicopper oxidase with cupredoxin domain